MWFMADRNDGDASGAFAMETKVTAQQVADTHGSNGQDSCYSAVAGIMGVELLVVDIAGHVTGG